VDWAGWATFGLGSTLLLTAVMVGAQLQGWTRMDLPLMLGTMFSPAPDRARFVGFFIHLAMGQVFALVYAASFALLGLATWWLGMLFGAFHALVVVTVLLRVMAGVHPRMATERSGPEVGARLEPPGLLARNYGSRTPLFMIAAHLAYGTSLGVLLTAG
jgi:hypothetical protein